MNDLIDWKLPHLSPRFRDVAAARQAVLTKPTGALGALEELAIWLAERQQSERPVSRPAAAIVFASDHPVSRRGISAYPREVTRAMVANLVSGGAAASVLCAHLEIPFTVVDVGVDHDIDNDHASDHEGEADDPRASETSTPAAIRLVRAARDGEVGDLCDGDAMCESAMRAAMAAGSRAVDALPDDTRLLILGEMGIGNTTPAAAIAARLLDVDGDVMVGPGTGVSGEALQRKRQVVQRALARCTDAVEPIEALRRLGGRDLAALVSAMGRSAERGIPLVIDGFIVSAAALVAVRCSPAMREWMWFGHRSAEPGHQRILDALGAAPILDADLRLGEASGALTAVPLIDLAVALHNDMATFGEAGVPDRDDAKSRGARSEPGGRRSDGPKASQRDSPGS